MRDGHGKHDGHEKYDHANYPRLPHTFVLRVAESCCPFLQVLQLIRQGLFELVRTVALQEIALRQCGSAFLARGTALFLLGIGIGHGGAPTWHVRYHVKRSKAGCERCHSPRGLQERIALFFGTRYATWKRRIFDGNMKLLVQR